MSFNIIHKIEYSKLSYNKPTLAGVIMVKNEHVRIHVTLESVKNHVNALIVYDTGSTDNTILIIKEFCEKNKINLYLISGEFIDFSTSRNHLLDYCDTIDVKYLLLLDCNDELKGGDDLIKFITYADSNFQNTGYYVSQKWLTRNKIDEYKNVKLVVNRRGWRFCAPVHEWIRDTSEKTYPIIAIPKSIYLYQDRNSDDGKTKKRFINDYKILLNEHKKNPEDTRTLFYLAQTCECLGKNDECFYYSKLRVNYKGFYEEVFISYMRCGNNAKLLGHDWGDVMVWYIKAYECITRAEPLIKIAEHYFNAKKYECSYLYARRACELEYPKQCILFVDNMSYDYLRWSVLSKCAYYVGEYDIGKQACLKAIKATNNKIDIDNLRFYVEKELEQKELEQKELEQKELEQKKSISKENMLKNDEKIKELYKDFKKLNPTMSEDKFKEYIDIKNKY